MVMSKQIKANSGTKPNISAKTQPKISNPSTLSSVLDIPEACMKELTEAGLEPRWIDIVQLKNNHGWHKREWQPFKFKCLSNVTAANPFGSTSGEYDGYLLRQQLVLAAKSKDKAEARRAYVRARTNMQSNPADMQKQKFTEYVKGGISGAKVHGFDEGDVDEE